MSMMLIAPITALEFSGNFLLAGEGPYIRCYNYHTTTLLARHKILKAENVHRIIIGPPSGTNQRLLVVNGGKTAVVARIPTDSVRSSFNLDVESQRVFPDRILTSSWLRNGDDQHLVLVTAHNSVLRWDWKNQNITSIIHSEEKCILYSALVIGSSWNDVVIAGGTVFNQVVLWAACGHENISGRQQVIHRLDGHEGVIFSITFNEDRGELCSVSDDRSIRIWQAVHGESTPSSLQDWGQARFLPLHVLYGHTARVWDARYLGNKLISIGEDSTCCVWSSDGKIIKRFKGHRGKSIWSLAVDNNSGQVATGGGDSGIRLWKTHDTNVDSNTIINQLSPPEHMVPKGTMFVPKVTRMVQQTAILIISEDGILYEYNITTLEWNILLRDDAYKSYSVLEVSLDGSVIIVGNIYGRVKIITEGKTEEVQCYDGKVFSIIWLAKDIALTTGPMGMVDMWQVVQRDDKLTLENLVKVVLPDAKQRWVAAAVYLEHQQLLICGDRVGSVHLYDIKWKERSPTQSFWKIHGKAGVTDIKLMGDFIYSAGRDGKYRQFKLNDRHLDLLHSTKVMKGFEWIARIFICEDDLQLIGFYRDRFILYSSDMNQTRLSIACGGGHRSWDFNIQETRDASFVYIKAGFVELCTSRIQTDHTVLKPALHGREITDVSHIASFATETGFTSIIATCSEDTMINIISISQSKGEYDLYHVMEQIQGHLSSVRALAVSPSRRSSIGIVEKPQPCHSHSTSTRSHLLFSGGGRAEIKCWRLSLDSGVPTTSSVASNTPLVAGINGSLSPTCLYEHLATHTLCNKSHRNRKPWKKRFLDSNPETRFMSLTAFPLTEYQDGDESRVHVIAAACSDAFVRLLAFQEDKRSFQVIAQTDFHDHCVLSVQHVFIRVANEVSAYLCTAGTDGKVALWNISQIISQYLKCCKSQCQHLDEAEENLGPCCTDFITDFPAPDLVIVGHQSGVNSIDIRQVKGNKYLLVTGGDDNCLCAHQLLIEEGKLTLLSSCRKVDAHAAQINGVFIQSESSVISASIDQKLVSWQLSPDLELKHVSAYCLNVADVSRMRCWETGDNINTVVSGVGLEFICILDCLIYEF